MPKNNRQVMGNKWEKARASRDRGYKNVPHLNGHFFVRKNKKEKRYKLMLDA